MNPNAKFIVLVVSDSNLNTKVDGPGFETLDDAIAHGEGITSDPQQRLNVVYVVPVAGMVVDGHDVEETFEDEDGEE